MEKYFVGRKKRQNRKEKQTEMKDGKKWEHMEFTWQVKYKKKKYLNKDLDETTYKLEQVVIHIR